MDYQVLWFVLLGVLLAGYAILDGFDLGVGILHLNARGDDERRVVLNSIGPLWDGNEVWLVTFGGALFAAFPEAYATAFSGFYTVFMGVLAGLIFRAVSIEFRGKRKSSAWRGFWDVVFFGSSLLATALFGAAVGAAIKGVPLDQRGVFRGTLASQLGWYPLLVAALAVALFAMHGALYLRLKTSGDLRERVTRWAWNGHAAFVVLYLATTTATVLTTPRATANFEAFPWAWLVVGLNVLAVLNVSRSLKKGQDFAAFFSSCCTVAALVFLFGVALFPDLITSAPNGENSLTIRNAASSETTLRLMSLFALLGMPFVIAYTAVVYWSFRGEVRLDEHSY